MEIKESVFLKDFTTIKIGGPADYFFIAKKWKGIPTNEEPQKCDDLAWFPLNRLPKNTIPYIRVAIKKYLKKIFYSEFGWKIRNEL